MDIEFQNLMPQETDSPYELTQKQVAAAAKMVSMLQSQLPYGADEQAITYIGATNNIQTITYKKAGVTIKTRTFSYAGEGAANDDKIIATQDA